jgi:hypothetical protein
MAPGIFELLAMYGITFGAMNKADFLHGKHPFTDRLLACSYCTGFHAGWSVWLLTRPLHEGLNPLEAVVWAFAGAVTSYGLDTALQLAESWVRKSDDE